MTTFDAVTAGSLSNSTSLTFSHTVTTNGNRVLYVFVCWWETGGNLSTSCTYAGTGMTRIDNSGLSTGNDRVEIYRLIAPATGANNVVLTTGSSSNAGKVIAVSFYDADQTDPDGAISKQLLSGGADPSQAVSSASGDIVVDAVAWDASGGQTVTVGAGQTQRHNSTSNGEGGASSTEPGAASVTMSWTLSGSSTGAYVAFNVISVAAAADPFKHPILSISTVLARY